MLRAFVIALLLLIPSLAQADWHQRGTDMKPRLQWNSNYGYCGETSLISAGLALGQYTSQWDARRLASPGVPQTQQRSQLLLGSNAIKAADKMKLVADHFKTGQQRSSREFYRWIKTEFLRGNRVIIGVFNNVNSLGEPAWLADRLYDHIVPVFGIGSSRRLSDHRYYGDDNIFISDNGLYSIGRNYPFIFRYELKRFFKTRRAANRLGHDTYSLRDSPPNYGISVRGIKDLDRRTVPVRLSTDTNNERVQNQARMKKPPRPVDMTLTANLRVPVGKTYRLYMYDSFQDTPTKDFNRQSGRAKQVWTLQGRKKVWRINVKIKSNQTRVFRALPLGAP